MSPQSLSVVSLSHSLAFLSDGWIVSVQIYLHHVRGRQQLKAPLLWNKWDQRDTHYLLCYLRGLGFLPCSLGGFSKSTAPQQTCREHLIGFTEHGAGACRVLGGIIEPDGIKTSLLLWTIKHWNLSGGEMEHCTLSQGWLPLHFKQGLHQHMELIAGGFQHCVFVRALASLL